MDINTLLTSVLVSTALSGALIWLLKTLIAEKLRQDLTSFYNHKLEAYKAELRADVETRLETKKAELRADVETRLEERKAELKAKLDTGLESIRDGLAQIRSIQTAATSALTSTYASANERRLVAIEEIWKTMLKIRADVGKTIVYLDLLPSKDVAQAHKNPKLLSLLAVILTREDFETMMAYVQSCESFRPFAGEALWAYFYGYRAFLYRVAVYYITEFEKNKQLTHWLSDALAQKILMSLLTKSEIEQVQKNPVRLVSRIADIIEQKFLLLAQDVVSGKAAGSHALDQAQRILDAIAESDQETIRGNLSESKSI